MVFSVITKPLSIIPMQGLSNVVWTGRFRECEVKVGFAVELWTTTLGVVVEFLLLLTFFPHLYRSTLSRSLASYY